MYIIVKDFSKICTCKAYKVLYKFTFFTCYNYNCDYITVSTINIFLNMQMQIISQASKINLSNEHNNITFITINLHLYKCN